MSKAKFRLSIGDKIITNDPTDDELLTMKKTISEQGKVDLNIHHHHTSLSIDPDNRKYVSIHEAIVNIETGEKTIIREERIPLEQWEREQEEIERVKHENEELKKALKQKRRGKLGPIATNGFFKTPADRINKAMIESLAPGALKPKDQITPALEALEARGAAPSHLFWAAHTFDSASKSKGEIHGAIGYTKDPGEALWAMMETNNATAIKMQFILWARAYSETDAEPGQFIRLSVSQLCDDLGYKRKKGAHKRENKQKAGEVFEMLVQREIAVIGTDPKGKPIRLRGPIWNRGISADEYEDLFGANRAGDPASWIPSVLSYSPGDWFNEPTWRAYNRHIALIGEGLLKLSGEKKDKYAVLIGGYLGMLARMNSYRTSFIKAKTLLEKSGLWAADATTNPGRMIEKLKNALDRLVEVEVIKGWRYKGKDDPSIDYDNLDDPDTLAALADDGADPDERNRVIIIEWPDKLEERRIEIQAKQQKHLREGKRRRSTKPKRGE